jgi:Ser/Thr protein kinase RdoA (MazF antagonist)
MHAIFHEVLKQYPSWAHGVPTALGGFGGFSGARLWRIDQTAGRFCLKAWPVDGRSREELLAVHRLMAKAAALAWMPRVVPTTERETLVYYQDRLWELTTWMPGQADFSPAPSTARIEAACTALGQLHVLWASLASPTGRCPGILRRWHAWRLWTKLQQSGWRPRWAALDPYAAIAEPLFHAVQRCRDEVPHRLRAWLNVPLRLQPCVCDPWRAHVLYTGDAVTGLVDFGSAKTDHIAVDLARLLGSLVGDEGARWQIGINSYRQVGPITDDECRLARDLDRIGTVLAATHWLRWLYLDGRRFDSPSAVLERLQYLLARLRA